MQTMKWELYPLVPENSVTRAFIEELVQVRKSASTIDNYSRDLKDFLQVNADIPFSRLLERDESQVARYVDGLCSCPACRGSGCKLAKENMTYMNGSHLALNAILRRVSTICALYDWCIEFRKRQNQLNPVPRGVRGKKRGLLICAPSAPWLPRESQFADLLLYVFATTSLCNQELILVLYDGALRREEVAFLRKDPIDERNYPIKIPHELTKNKMQGQIVWSNTTWKILHGYLQEDRARFVAAYRAEDAGSLFLPASNKNAALWQQTPISEISRSYLIRHVLVACRWVNHKAKHHTSSFLSYKRANDDKITINEGENACLLDCKQLLSLL